MIRHYDEFVEDDIWILFRQPQPFLFHDFSRCVQNHFFIFDFAKKIFTVLYTGCDKICAVGSVVEFFETR